MRRIIVAALACLLSVGVAHQASAQNGRELFQQALVKERAEGDLAGAIAIYQRIARDYAGDHELAAGALVQMGECYERLGSTEAERAYQRVLREFADQTEYVAQARTRLAALGGAAPAERGPFARRLLTSADVPEEVFRAMGPSPDGRQTAFINTDNGGVYLLDVASGDTTRIAVGEPIGWTYFPVFSPDGRRVAFAQAVRGTDSMAVKIVDLATRRTMVVPGTERRGWTDVEEWSKDGRWLLCNPGEDSLGIIAADGGTMVVLTDSAYRGTGSLSPDARFVAYAAGDEQHAHVYVRAVAGGPALRATSTPGGNLRPLWSPDGRAIAYQRPSGIWVMPMADGRPSGPPRQAVAAANVELRHWNDAGLFYLLHNLTGTRMLPYQVAMDPGTGRPVDALQPFTGDHPDSAFSFGWSPDMRHVAFGHQLSAEVTVASTDPRSVQTFDLGRLGHAINPTWSSDGREVLYENFGGYSSGRQAEHATVVALDPSTGRARELFPRIPRARGFTLSRDGRRMAYYRMADPNATSPPDDADVVPYTVWGRLVQAVVVSRPGAPDGREVATAGGQGQTPFSGNMPPRLSPRGDQVAFVRQEPVRGTRQRAPEASGLWVVGADGGGARRIASAALILSAEWDPTGRFIAYSARPEMADVARGMVIRVVDVTTGAQTDVPVPEQLARDLAWHWLRVTDWSSNGRLLGIVAGSPQSAPWEYWVVRGLQAQDR